MFNYCICNEAWRQLFTRHTNFHSVCYHFRPVCGWLSVALLDSGELVSEFTAISMSHYNEYIWKPNLGAASAEQVGQMQPNCKTRMKVCCQLVQEAKLRPTWVWTQEYLSLFLSYPASSGFRGKARTVSPGDVQQWLSCHGREGAWGGSTCGTYSSVTNFH